MDKKGFGDEVADIMTGKGSAARKNALIEAAMIRRKMVTVPKTKAASPPKKKGGPPQGLMTTSGPAGVEREPTPEGEDPK